MAVYTEVSDDELARFRLGRRLGGGGGAGGALSQGLDDSRVLIFGEVVVLVVKFIVRRQVIRRGRVVVVVIPRQGFILIIGEVKGGRPSVEWGVVMRGYWNSARYLSNIFTTRNRQ